VKKSLLLLAAAALLTFAVVRLADPFGPRSAAPSRPAANDAATSRPEPAAAGVTAPAAPAAAAKPAPESAQRFDTLLADVRAKVEAAQRASDFDAADRQVDEALLTPGLEPVEKQRLMAVKMGSRGMRGDHAAMLALMDEIIAVAPDSTLAAQILKERPQLEKIQRLGPNHPELCETCGKVHAPGAHPAAKAAEPAKD